MPSYKISVHFHIGLWWTSRMYPPPPRATGFVRYKKCFFQFLSSVQWKLNYQTQSNFSKGQICKNNNKKNYQIVFIIILRDTFTAWSLMFLQGDTQRLVVLVCTLCLEAFMYVMSCCSLCLPLSVSPQAVFPLFGWNV